ncbi:hypothetical protein BGZ76_000315 [Entomortierella beljakovae]|nr:hypothetical protein BGZ76_000315 [Entomortierella beljakovae]
MDNNEHVKDADTNDAVVESLRQRTHPLLIPEILLQVAPMLTQHTVFDCVLVCRSWHTCLMPFLFQRINLPRRKQIKKSKFASRPLISTLRKNASCIRTLICEDSNTILQQITPNCTSIETLVLGNITPEILPILRLCKETLVQLELMPSRTLVMPNVITFSCGSTTYITPKQYREISGAVLELSMLKHLVIDYLGIRDEEQLNSFFEFCTQLRSLEIHQNGIIGAAPTTLQFPNMKSLSIVDSSMRLSDQLALIWACPSLDHVTWIRQGHAIPLESFSQLWKDGRQELKSLDLSNGVTPDGQLHVVFSRLLNLSSLVAQNSKFGMLSLSELLKHLKDKIQVLDLTGCQSVTPEMVQQIMQTCPALKSLSADRLRAIDVLESRQPWVCHDLEQLRIVVTGPSILPIMETQHAIYNQIGKLKRLKLLNLGRYLRPSLWFTQSILDLSLSGGFRQLGLLKELQVFDFCQMDHKLGMEEYKFMLKSWPKLDTLHGQLSSSHDRSAFIESFLKNERPWLRIRSSMRYERRTTRTEK